MLWFRYWPLAAVLIGMYVLESGWAAIFLYHAGLVSGIWQKRESILELPWRSPAVVNLGLVVAGLVAAPIVYWGLPWFTTPDIGAGLSDRLSVLGLTGWSFWGFAVYFVTVHPFLEETGWRGALLERSRRVHINDFEFAAYHLLVLHWLFPGEWLLLVGALFTLTVSAWFWRQLRDAFGMASVVAFHAAADLGVIVATACLAGVPVPGG